MILAFRNLVRRVHTENFTIHRVTKADRKEVQQLMLQGFYKTDPSAIYSGVAGKRILSSELLKMTLEPIEQGLSFLVRVKEEDNVVAGVIINGVRPTVLKSCYMKALIREIECEKEKTLLELWRFMSLMPRNAQRFFGDEQEVLEFRYLAVDERYKHRGIGTSLVKCSRNEAKDKGYKFVRIDCTSSFTARIASALGFRCIFAINYRDYKNPRGEKIFQKTTPPHTGIQIFMGESDGC